MTPSHLLRPKGLSLLCATLFLSGCDMAILNPKGPVGAEEKTLLIAATVLMLLVVVPVIVMVLAFAWKYRASNEKAVYTPDWAHSNGIEAVVWTVPCLIIVVLAVLTWKSSHALDPYRPLDSAREPVTIEVVALDWKWLFIYPDQQIATVNEIAFPVDTPVNFKITSDTVMNSFFIPQLGSQIYAMAGMETQLHLLAHTPGTYAGISANYSGHGFSDMRFAAHAMGPEEYEAWIAKVKASGSQLDRAELQKLAVPTQKTPVAYYGSVTPLLFDATIERYMAMGKSGRELQIADAMGQTCRAGE
ncbi:ubiquinol oxidase subunit II [Ramlibacter sp. H39-3-26]|uniref:ubiquinol oxidase subunit II n=1 Tax=Curvibacter soli TaxID=3031331 RepID=UPI0023DC1CA1|nr:ubiquinol oxidase subunit II [Ramlibacter sp. H39-3-26]MDF1486536.1 ubiquinol oxidase subunit II [Ramlibacter sp. H39-3-26]